MEDKIRIVVTRMRGYNTIESRETVVRFVDGIDEDLLRETFTKAEGSLLNLRGDMDTANRLMESVMLDRAPVEATLIAEG